MPLYEYECEACAHRFEVIQKFSDAPISVCPKCGGPVQKLLSSPAIQFKGSGFYLTDYAKKSGGTEGTSPRGGADKAGDKAGEKTSDAGSAKSDSAGSAAGNSASPAAGAASASPAPAAPAAGGGKSPGGSGGE